MSDSSQSQLYYLEEVTWGVIPAVALNAMRFTSESLAQATSTVESAEIRSDRQVPDVLRTNIAAEGDINWELSYGAHDDLFKAFMMDDWAGGVGISGEVDIGMTAGSPAVMDGAVGEFANVVVGQWIRTNGFTNTENNGYWKVVAKAGDSSTIDIIGGPPAAVTEAAGASVSVGGDFIKNGVTERHLTIEKRLTDVSEFMSYSGCRIGQLRLEAAIESIVTGSFTIAGKSEVPAGATVGTGGDVAAPTNPVLSVVDNVFDILEGTTFSSLRFSQLSIQAENGLRPQAALGSLGATQIGLGTFRVSGTLRAYFESRTILEKYTNFTPTAVAVRFSEGDATGAGYVFDIPDCKFTRGQVVAGGQDQDIIADLEFTGRLDADAGSIMFGITRFAT